jgi:hypothetical protein
MASIKEKEEVLFETKQINSLKLKRNNYAPGSKNKKALQSIIDVAESALKEKRKRYGI